MLLDTYQACHHTPALRAPGQKGRNAAYQAGKNLRPIAPKRPGRKVFNQNLLMGLFSRDRTAGMRLMSELRVSSERMN